MPAFSPGDIESDSDAVERSIRLLALSRKNALFAGSDDGGDHWAVASLIEVGYTAPIARCFRNPTALLTASYLHFALGTLRVHIKYSEWSRRCASRQACRAQARVSRHRSPGAGREAGA